MGRHSAQDEDDESGVLPEDAAAAPSVVAVRVGRHARADESDEEPTTGAAKPAHPKREGGTHADLRLLREQPTLRARCAAAVVVPFVLYTAVMIVIGHVGAYIVWVWIPTVLAGVLVGSFLDGAHRREVRAAAAAADRASDPDVRAER